MYWRRFPVSSIPVDDSKAFEEWVLQRWREKDDLLEYYSQHGRFPPSPESLDGAANASKQATGEKDPGHLVTEVKLAQWFEVGQIFVVIAAVGLVLNVLLKFWRLVRSIL